MPDPVFLSLVFQVAYPQNQPEFNIEKRTRNSVRMTRHPHEKKRIHTQPYNLHTHVRVCTHTHQKKKKTQNGLQTSM